MDANMNAPEEVVPGRDWMLTIHKSPDGRWMVDRPEDAVHRERDSVTWTLDAPKGARVSAHFQFLDGDLLGVDSHLTAEIAAPGGKLTLRPWKEACRRRNPRRYAVWVQEEGHPRGGEFAIGMNPPPEISFGP